MEFNQDELLQAIWDNDVEKTRCFFDNGVDIDARLIDETTPLILVCQCNWRENLGVASLILSYKPDINAKDESGDTALLDAARNGLPNIVKALLEQGADIDISSKHC